MGGVIFYFFRCGTPPPCSATSLNKKLASEEREAAAAVQPRTGLDLEISLTSKLGRKAMSTAVLANAPSISVPFSDELVGSLRSLKSKGSMVRDQFDAKNFAVDPQLKVNQTLNKYAPPPLDNVVIFFVALSVHILSTKSLFFFIHSNDDLTHSLTPVG